MVQVLEDENDLRDSQLGKKGVSLEVNKKFTSSFSVASSQGEDTFIRSLRRGDVSFHFRNLK